MQFLLTAAAVFSHFCVTFIDKGIFNLTQVEQLIETVRMSFFEYVFTQRENQVSIVVYRNQTTAV